MGADGRWDATLGCRWRRSLECDVEWMKWLISRSFGRRQSVERDIWMQVEMIAETRCWVAGDNDRWDAMMWNGWGLSSCDVGWMRGRLAS